MRYEFCDYCKKLMDKKDGPWIRLKTLRGEYKYYHPGYCWEIVLATNGKTEDDLGREN